MKKKLQKMKIAFTICSLNYFAQALSLGESLNKTNPQYQYVIGLVDKIDELYKYEEKELISLVERSNIVEIDKHLIILIKILNLFFC